MYGMSGILWRTPPHILLEILAEPLEGNATPETFRRLFHVLESQSEAIQLLNSDFTVPRKSHSFYIC